MKKIVTPKHIAFIMDGNRRWARQHRKPSLAGHKAGYDRMVEIGLACLDFGISYVTVYAFSTENWNRSKVEVTYLMQLLTRALTKELDRFTSEGVRIRVIGEKRGLSKDILKAVKNAMEKTRELTRGEFIIALNYGARDEIVGAVNSFLKEQPRANKISTKQLASHLYTKEIPDPDLLIRTSGELRLSNFLLWQIAYSELYFSKVYWPDFTVSELKKALTEYAKRERRFGGG